MNDVGQLDAHVRAQALARLRGEVLDVLVIGGGVTGTGAALDAAARGLRVGLIEQDDFASGTSSKSSKMIHGGIRYLAQGNFALVREALHERARLLTTIAPHLVQPVAFWLPLRHPGQRLLLGVGTRLYDLLGGARQLPRARYVPRAELARRAPALRCAPGGAIQFYDALTDDARYVLTLARTAAAHGALLATGIRAETVMNDHGRVVGVTACDLESGECFAIRARHLLGATGAWSGEWMARSGLPAPSLRPSKGVHLVVDKQALALAPEIGVIARTDHGLLFIIPWQGHWLIGDTDSEWRAAPDAPVPTAEDAAELLARLEQCCGVRIHAAQIRGMFAGLRPLVAANPRASTVQISREHRIDSPLPGLSLISGGKFTTYRVMAAQLVDAAVRDLGMARDSSTADLPLLGAQGYAELWARRAQLAREHALPEAAIERLLQRYGSGIDAIFHLFANAPELRRCISDTRVHGAEIIYACTHEGARHIEDVMARRTRIAILTPQHTRAALDEVVQLMQGALGWTDETCKQERERYLTRSAAGQRALLPPDPLSACWRESR